MKSNKTTAKHFEIFKAECQKWIEIFGLKGWRFVFEHEDGMEDCHANYTVKLQGRVCTIFLSTDWRHEKITEEQLRKSAFHEVCHIVLVRLQIIGESRFIHADEFSEEVHAIIRTLENVLWEAK